MPLPVVHVEPADLDIEVEPGETIIEAAWRQGYHWPTICYGDATCTVCHLEVLAGEENLSPVEDEEADALEHNLPTARRRDLTRIRLACRALASGDVRVRKPGVRRS